MMYTLDLSGYDADGAPGVERMGGLFQSADAAEKQGRLTAETGRLFFKPTTIWVRDQENLVVKQVSIYHVESCQMTYLVSVLATTGRQIDYLCSGANDQVALIYAGKIVEAHAESFSPDDAVNVTRDGFKIGPLTTVGEMTSRTTRIVG